MNADELARLLDELGRRLGPAGEHVFRLAVERVVIANAVGLVFAVAAVAGLVAFDIYVFRLVRRYERANAGKTYYDKQDADGWLIGAALTSLAGVGALVWVYVAIVNLLTPEYTALRDILSAIRP